MKSGEKILKRVLKAFLADLFSQLINDKKSMLQMNFPDRAETALADLKKILDADASFGLEVKNSRYELIFPKSTLVDVKEAIFREFNDLTDVSELVIIGDPV